MYIMFNSLKAKIAPMLNTKGLMILVVSVIFIGISLYVYNAYVSPRLNPSYVANKEFVEEGTQNEVELLYFYTEWCPYCKKSRPIWNELKEKYAEHGVNNTRVYFKEIDCDKEEQMADEYKVEGYPTIKMVKDGQIIEYDAKPDLETLETFLHTTLQ